MIKVAYRSLLSLDREGRALEQEKKSAAYPLSWQLSLELDSLKCPRKKKAMNSIDPTRTHRIVLSIRTAEVDDNDDDDDDDKNHFTFTRAANTNSPEKTKRGENFFDSSSK